MDKIGMKETCVTSFATEKHTTVLKNDAKSEIASSTNDAMRRTMITMAPTTTNPTAIDLPVEDAMKGVSSFSLTT
jgi:hypothetical protein